MMFQIDYTPSAHLLALIETPEYKTYASLNFHHRPVAYDGKIEPNINIIHGYVLDPVKGSMTFVLEFNKSFGTYLQKEGDELDAEILYQINLAIKKVIKD